MSTYTTEVRFICETFAGEKESVGHNDTDKVILAALPKIFDFDFPMFDENYRTVLEKKILRHFYYKEIGCETVGLWKDMLQTRLNEVMPYFNDLYKTTLFDFNPNYQVNYTRKIDNVDDNTNVTSGTVEHYNKYEPDTVNKNYFSDTPQGTTENLDNNGYLTTYTKNTNAGQEENSGHDTWNDLTNKIDNIKDYTEHVFGIQNGNEWVAMLQSFRASLFNIDLKIMDSLNDLFMNIF